ncbi:5-formyltetrahydrofolate cyclo-ligase [Planococcus sp. CAU13]|uniref:5-formyltetrahydrofolate cyclo-ligase n=1 Tax=Planococcus sp. CAU13 TaxID=1541197 RepID=UPI00052FE963|nr:5-formyltetrahydrofolate cyclo-ligase [Planococcus sp. CAU13]
MEKSIQRKEMNKKLKAMDPAVHQQKSDAIIEFLIKEPEFQDASVIGLTVSAFPEVDTHRLIELCWKAGKKTAVPKCDPLTRAMSFRIIEDFSQLETVYMKLLEPIVEQTEEVSPEEIDLLLVPGVVFSAAGYRIGFGGGYYDRYLTRYAGPTKSLAFAMQLADSVPVETHDMPVQRICTELGCMDTGAVKP